MSTKNIVHDEKAIDPQSKLRARFILIGVGLCLVIMLGSAFVTLQIRSQSTTIVPHNATAVQYNNTLALEYAAPWLEKQQVRTMPSSDLANQFAQPSLTQPTKESAPTVQYSNAAALFIARPWLAAQRHTFCTSRLDRMYACRYGFQP